MGSFKAPLEEEDELDVSGIVRKQSDEEYGGEKEKPSDKSDTSSEKKPYTSSSINTAANSSNSSSGSTARSTYSNAGESLKLSVDTRSPPYSQKRSSSSNQEDPGSGIRRDKVVSFDSSSPRATPSLKGISAGLTLGDTYALYDPVSPRVGKRGRIRC